MCAKNKPQSASVGARMTKAEDEWGGGTDRTLGLCVKEEEVRGLEDDSQVSAFGNLSWEFHLFQIRAQCKGTRMEEGAKRSVLGMLSLDMPWEPLAMTNLCVNPTLDQSPSSQSLVGISHQVHPEGALRAVQGAAQVCL